MRTQQNKFVAWLLSLAMLLTMMPLLAQDAYAAGDWLDASADSYGRVWITGHTDSTDGFTRIELRNTAGTAWKLLGEPYEQDLKAKQLYYETANDFGVGIYEIRAKLSDGSYVYGRKQITLGLGFAPLKPTKDWMLAGNKYIAFRANQAVPSDSDGMYVQVTGDKAFGTKVYGPVKSYKDLKIKGLKPNKSYKVRTYFAKKVKSGSGTTLVKSKLSPSVTVKTGKNEKLKIKSVKISKVKQTRRNVSRSGYWDAGGVWHKAQSGVVWETSFTVTVKLKKKPGTKGIYIGDKKCKGNKKTYSATIKMNGKLKGRKLKLGLCSYNDNTYGGTSPQVKKTLKIK